MSIQGCSKSVWPTMKEQEIQGSFNVTTSQYVNQGEKIKHQGAGFFVLLSPDHQLGILDAKFHNFKPFDLIKVAPGSFKIL